MDGRFRAPASVLLILVGLFAMSWTQAASGQSATEAPADPLPVEATPVPVETPGPVEEPQPKPQPKPQPNDEQPDRSASPTRPRASADHEGRSRPHAGVKQRRKPVGLDRTKIWWSIGYRTPGTFDTRRISRTAARLEALGHHVSKTELYAPFIIAGRAEWSDTWGAIRHAEHDNLRPHLGQDVYCDIGAPVLATEAGTIEFTTDPLGGLVAKLHRNEGGYFYYAHLASWNTKKLSSGDAVKSGDVIGFCGKSGNAATTPPHVHFGWVAGGLTNPMQLLIDRLRAAENQALRLLARIRKERIASTKTTTTERLYGEGFLPNLSTISCVASTPSVLATSGVELVELVEADSEDCSEF